MSSLFCSVIKPVLNLNLAPTDLSNRRLLRAQLRKLRRSLSAVQQQQASLKVIKHLRSHPWYWSAQHIALYQAADGELNLAPLINVLLADKKMVYLPVLAKWPRTQMSFQRITADSCYQANRFGLAEPLSNASQQRLAWALDLVLMPLVGFDQQGNRLGMGGGFYDRAFASVRVKQPKLMGVAHSVQQVEQLTAAAWDVPLDAVLTEQQLTVFTTD